MRFPRPPWGVRGPRQTSGLIGQRWKHREVLASRLVLITADTKQNPTHPPPPGTPEKQLWNTRKKGGAGDACGTHIRELFATTMQTTINPPPTRTRARALVACGIGKVGHKVCGGHSTGETPSNIPNLEAKPGRANGTAPQGVWESRKPPQHTRGGAAHTSTAPPHTPTHTHTPTRTHTHTRGHTARAREHATTRTREEYRTHARNTTTQNQPSSTRRLVWT